MTVHLPPSSLRDRRRLFLDIVKRRVRPGTGSSRQFLEIRMANQTWPDLTNILKEIPWCVAGAVATRTYMPERATQDLDILVAQENSAEAREALRKADYRFRQELSIGGSSWGSPSGVLVELIESDAPWVPDAFGNLQTDPQGLPVLSFPYLGLMKFQAGRTQDLADLSRMLGLASVELRNQTRAIFREWEAEGMEDLESLIALGELEMGVDRDHVQ